MHKAIKIEVGEKKLELVFDFNAIAAAEELTGINLLACMANLGEVNAKQLRGLFYAALRAKQPKMTLEQVGELFTPGNINIIIQAVVDCYLAARAEAEPDPNVEAAAE